ncbi:hypothetical protein [Neptunicoccus sediminis]|uniref:hypothetical protein n=1 Tax=Neptunicoccus sediminis TaxID=1892596 RepID=UPI00084609AC|nr:hypothetical protein [Neptunicoccus sediminis]
MRRTTTTLLAAAVALMPVIAEAKKDDYHKQQKKLEKAYKEHEKAHKRINKAYEKADKEWRKHHGHSHVYHRGDVIERNYRRISNPVAYGLDPNQAYYLVADQIYRMDPETRKVLAIVGLAAELLN